MPDRATVLAATPKCPVPLPACGTPMHWKHEGRVWVCPRHHLALTAGTLLAKQRTVAARPQPAPS